MPEACDRVFPENVPLKLSCIRLLEGFYDVQMHSINRKLAKFLTEFTIRPTFSLKLSVNLDDG
jgi:hypothetical protein